MRVLINDDKTVMRNKAMTLLKRNDFGHIILNFAFRLMNDDKRKDCECQSNNKSVRLFHLRVNRFIKQGKLKIINRKMQTKS